MSASATQGGHKKFVAAFIVTYHGFTGMVALESWL